MSGVTVAVPIVAESLLEPLHEAGSIVYRTRVKPPLFSVMSPTGFLPTRPQSSVSGNVLRGKTLFRGMSFPERDWELTDVLSGSP